jgi:hypothetical protein
LGVLPLTHAARAAFTRTALHPENGCDKGFAMDGTILATLTPGFFRKERGGRLSPELRLDDAGDNVLDSSYLP